MEGGRSRVEGGRKQGRGNRRGSTASRSSRLPVPQEEGDAKQDDDRRPRQDDVHVTHMEALHVHRILVATRIVRSPGEGGGFAHDYSGRRKKVLVPGRSAASEAAAVASLVNLSIGPMVNWSIGPLVHWSICPLVYWSIGLLVHWSIGQKWFGGSVWTN